MSESAGPMRAPSGDVGPVTTTRSTSDFAGRPERLAITAVSPSVAGGVYPAKRVQHDIVEFEAVVVCDGHVEIGGQVRVVAPDGAHHAVPLVRGVGYTFSAEMPVDQLGTYEFVVDAWVDHAATLQSRIARKRAAGQDVANEEEELRRLDDTTRSDLVSTSVRRIVVDRLVASFGAWYEFFPRSTLVGPDATAANDDDGTPAPSGRLRHGTLRDAITRVPYVQSLGFDILYLPPIHPIGRDHRKGVNNAVESGPDDVGSPWAIGAAEGGHTAIHPALGTLDDFDALVAETTSRGIDLALDIAFQCAPDHPWVGEHPEWFAIRPDGSIAYAENPPKQYQDIVPFDFDSAHWQELWHALADVVRFWHRRGVRVFRVDNPHTKPFRFWQWLIAELKAEDPGIVFLAEAFAHPEVMLQLSRVGFSVSYTHFPWQHSPQQIRDYSTLLSSGDNIEFFRGSAWPNTPDILTAELQQGLRQVFVSRLVLAATLSASYGIYGPVFELQVADAVREGSEEYQHGEKYEVREWDITAPHSLADVIRRVNTIRREHVALQHDRSLRFHHSDNPRMVAFTKTAPKRLGTEGLSAAPVLVVVNTDHYNPQEGVIRLDLSQLGAGFDGAYEAHDLISDQRFVWHGADNFVRLDPWYQSAHVFALRPLDVSDQQKELA